MKANERRLSVLSCFVCFAVNRARLGRATCKYLGESRASDALSPNYRYARIMNGFPSAEMIRLPLFDSGLERISPMLDSSASLVYSKAKNKAAADIPSAFHCNYEHIAV